MISISNLPDNIHCVVAALVALSFMCLVLVAICARLLTAGDY